MLDFGGFEPRARCLVSANTDPDAMAVARQRSNRVHRVVDLRGSTDTKLNAHG